MGVYGTGYDGGWCVGFMGPVVREGDKWGIWGW